MNTSKSAYFWNAASGLLMGFQSLVMAIVITRVCGVEAAGIFTIAYADANLFLNIGKYGIRPFQVSDTQPEYSFWDYARSRFATCLAMMIFAFIYLAYAGVNGDYSTEKYLIIILMCFFKLIDAVEDLMHSHYQQHGRLDIGAKMLTLRLSVSLVLFVLLVIIAQSVLIALLVSTIVTTLIFCGQVIYAKVRYNLPADTQKGSTRKAFRLLAKCFPMCAAAFLLFYISNAPKYSIDLLLGDTIQAYFGYISMPVFFVNLVASFIYNPSITDLSDTWAARDAPKFKKIMLKLVAATALVSIACVLLAALLGVPVLNFLYGVDVSAYWLELVLLVTGGGFVAFSALFTTAIIVIRFQGSLLVSYSFVTIGTLIATPWAVSSYGIFGASLVYVLIMVVLTLAFMMSLYVGFSRGIKNLPEVSA